MPATDNLNRYRTISRLGAGGMATVVLAEDMLLGRQVALKRVTAMADARNISRLRREALVGASVSHQNLVSIYDVVAADDGNVVIVMEYVPGETLADTLSREGKLAPERALRILDGVAAGLDAIHERDIVHRDVKPPNVLLGTGGTVKLADLGIAHVADRTRITSSGAVVGSWRYMAPEQLEDTPSTRAIDVYALAAVAFEMLSGCKARREQNPMALAHAITTRPPPDLREVWPGAPAGVPELLRRAMARDPSERPRSAGELTKRLRAALEPQHTAELVPAPATPARPAPATPARPVAAPPARPAPPLAAARPQDPPRRARPVPEGTESGRSGSRPILSGALDRRALPGRRQVVLAVLALAVVAAGVVALVGSGGSNPPAQRSASTVHRSHGRRRSRRAGSATRAAGAGGATTASEDPSGSAASTSSEPVAAVESFYRLAAAHNYSAAWALTDPAFQAQLKGYRSFENGQAQDKSISFDSAQVVSQSASSATVAVRTTSTLTSGTQHCAGTVDLQPGSSAAQWLLHQIDITC